MKPTLTKINYALTGCCSDLTGDCSGLTGDCTGLEGNCTGLMGNLDTCELSTQERDSGVDIQKLVVSNGGRDGSK